MYFRLLDRHSPASSLIQSSSHSLAHQIGLPQVNIMSMTCNRWLSVRLEFLGGLLILVTAFNCVIERGE